MDTLRQHRLLPDNQLAQLPNLTHGRCGDARAFAKTLIQRGWLSVYQVNQLLDGKAEELIIGPYYVLEKLGQGGLSAVYKGKHREHGNLVAVKIIKAEVFASAEGRQQFLQEIDAMARLDHPNVVQFCDADEWKNTFYFAMEYVEGTDLGKVVRLTGALPVSQACDYIRQAALGLQHAYERNLVHRDIKPVNLFLTQIAEKPRLPSPFATRHDAPLSAAAGKPTMQLRPLIKILDWGLACMRNPRSNPNEVADKSIVGTADYLAPEQARNAGAADIRSDLYGLGCSLYFLLTGQAPFPDGSLMQKIIQHQQAEPKPIETFREDVPATLTAIVQRMMAKNPDERFQTPASLAVALLPFTRRSNAGSGATLPTLKSLPKPTRDDTPIPPRLKSAQITMIPEDTEAPPN
jgi:serine/threonine protein kinase